MILDNNCREESALFSLTLQQFYSEPNLLSEWKRSDTPMSSSRGLAENTIFGDKFDFENTLVDIGLDSPMGKTNCNFTFKEEDCLDLDVFLKEYDQFK
jgi:LPS O-antigen subunit length determinant protein (WzzB/FepE family)